MLIGGISPSGDYQLFQVDTSGSFWTWKTAALGKGHTSARDFLGKRYVANSTVKANIRLALLALQQSSELKVVADQVEVVQISDGKFQRLDDKVVEKELEEIRS